MKSILFIVKVIGILTSHCYNLSHLYSGRLCPILVAHVLRARIPIGRDGFSIGQATVIRRECVYTHRLSCW